MDYIQNGSNSNNRYNTTEYNLSCAGKDCNNVATHCIKLTLIKRSGWFCDTCKRNLQEDGLVEFIFKESIVVGGESNLGKC